MKKYVLGIVIVVALAGLSYFYATPQPTRDSVTPQTTRSAGADPSSHYKADYKFSSDWFTNNIPVWERALAEFKGKPNIRYLEIGVFEGRSAIWMLENILTHPGAKLTAVDLFPSDLQQQFVANLDKSGLRHKVELLKGKSQERLRELKRESYDVIYIDGSHRAKHVFLDAALSWDLLKYGGVLVFDDYLWYDNKVPSDLVPKQPIDVFLRAFDDELELVHKGYQVLVRKAKGSCEHYMCSTIGRYGYVWTERILYALWSNKPVGLTGEERAGLEEFLMSYAGLRSNRRELGESIKRDKTMRKLDARLAFLRQAENRK